MTAANALQPQGPSSVPGKHRVETTSRRPHLPGFLHRAAKAEAAPVKPSPRPRTELKVVPSTQLIDTGKAGFSVDQLGVATKNVARRTARGYSTFAERTGSTLSEAYSANWVVQLFESEDQRKRRVNVQAVAQVLMLTATMAAKLAAARKGRIK